MGNKLERNSFYILIVKVLTSKSYLIDNKFPSFSAPKSYLRKGYEKKSHFNYEKTQNYQCSP